MTTTINQPIRPQQSYRTEVRAGIIDYVKQAESDGLPMRYADLRAQTEKDFGNLGLETLDSLVKRDLTVLSDNTVRTLQSWKGGK